MRIKMIIASILIFIIAGVLTFFAFRTYGLTDLYTVGGILIMIGCVFTLLSYIRVRKSYDEDEDDDDYEEDEEEDDDEDDEYE